MYKIKELLQELDDKELLVKQFTEEIDDLEKRMSRSSIKISDDQIIASMMQYQKEVREAYEISKLATTRYKDYVNYKYYGIYRVFNPAIASDLKLEMTKARKYATALNKSGPKCNDD